jgi:PPP family 3-phenylpropionic acid transporter
MLYWHFAAVYFFYFGIGGVFLPYWTIYLQTQGFSSIVIGNLISVFAATRIIAPGILSWLVHRYKKPIQLAQLATGLMWFSFMWIFYAHDFWNVALIMLLFSFFWHASLPQFEIATLNHLQDNTHMYATIRLWGSIGFVFTVISLGQILEFLETWIIPMTMLIMSVSLWLASLFIPESINVVKQTNSCGIQNSLVKKIALLAACFMMQASHSVYYVFYTSYLMQHGYSSTIISSLWALGVTIEVGLLLIMPKILQIYGARFVLITSFLLATLRWWLIGNFPNLFTILIIAQCLHAVTFGAFHSSAIYLVHKLFSSEHQQNLGQSLYSSISFGAGGATGSFASGYLWLKLGATNTFTIAAATAFLGAIIAWIWVDNIKNR